MRDPAFTHLDALIEHGWGDVPQPKIPANWREVRPEAKGPDGKRISEGKRRAYRKKRRCAKLEAVAAEMRSKYLTGSRIFGQLRAAMRWGKRASCK